MSKPSYPGILASTSLTSGIIACWPLNEGSGTSATDIVGGGVLDCSGTGVSWNASPLGLITNGSPSRAFLSPLPSYLQLFTASAPTITLLWLGKNLASPVDLGGFAGVTESSGSVNRYAIGLFSGKYTISGPGSVGFISTGTPVSGNTDQVVFRLDAAGVGILYGFLNNSDIGVKSTTGLTSMSYGATAEMFLGTLPGASAASNLRHDLLVLWNRAISDGEVASLNTDPWQIFAPPMSLMPASLNSGGQICGSKYGILTGGRF